MMRKKKRMRMSDGPMDPDLRPVLSAKLSSSEKRCEIETLAGPMGRKAGIQNA